MYHNFFNFFFTQPSEISSISKNRIVNKVPFYMDAHILFSLFLPVTRKEVGKIVNNSDRTIDLDQTRLIKNFSLMQIYATLTYSRCARFQARNFHNFQLLKRVFIQHGSNWWPGQIITQLTNLTSPLHPRARYKILAKMGSQVNHRGYTRTHTPRTKKARSR